MWYDLIRFIVLNLVRLFYPRLEIKGTENLPAGGPMIFVLNHPNGLMDPMLLMTGLKRPVSFLAKSTFFANPIGRLLVQAFGALPIYRQQDEGLAGGARGDMAKRNEATFARCRALLGQGGAMALFPEGTTHSETRLLPLRTGAARIALSAEAEANWKLGVQVTPVGLWYQNKTLFRTAALLVVGQSFELKDYASAYARDERQTVQALTDQIDASLDAVVLQAENAELLTGIPVVAAWTAPGQQPLSLAQQHARAARLFAAYERLRQTDPARLEALAKQAYRYARVLGTLGISDPWALELTTARRGRVIWLSLLLIVALPLALAGFILSYVPYRLARPLTPYLIGREEAVTSTGKLIIGSVLVLIGWIVEALSCGLLFGAAWGGLLLLSAPGLAYIALRWGEGWQEVREVAAYNWLRLRRRPLVEGLKARRQELAAQVMAAVEAAEQRPAQQPGHKVEV